MATPRSISTFAALAATLAVSSLGAASATAGAAERPRADMQAQDALSLADLQRARKCREGRVAVVRDGRVRCERRAVRSRTFKRRGVELWELMAAQGILGPNGELVTVSADHWETWGCTNVVVNGRWYAACILAYMRGNSGFALRRVVEWYSWSHEWTGSAYAWVSRYVQTDYYG